MVFSLYGSVWVRSQCVADCQTESPVVSSCMAWNDLQKNKIRNGNVMRSKMNPIAELMIREEISN